jgi:hypothetical protein
LALAIKPPRNLRLAVFWPLAACGTVINLLGALVHPSVYAHYVVSTVMLNGIFEHVSVDEIPDDIIFMHFLPQFSPVVAHYQLLVSYLSHTDIALKTLPWVQTNIRGFVENTPPNLSELDLWLLPLNWHVLSISLLFMVAVIFLLYHLVIELRGRRDTHSLSHGGASVGEQCSG